MITLHTCTRVRVTILVDLRFIAKFDGHHWEEYVESRLFEGPPASRACPRHQPPTACGNHAFI